MFITPRELPSIPPSLPVHRTMPAQGTLVSGPRLRKQICRRSCRMRRVGGWPCLRHCPGRCRVIL